MQFDLVCFGLYAYLLVDLWWGVHINNTIQIKNN